MEDGQQPKQQPEQKPVEPKELPRWQDPEKGSLGSRRGDHTSIEP